ncbi:unnamed protein product [Effrenium voratum]|uniref:Uncharacterized protein n=1 Tax=Effrenium voratum TaxID=2562239 RepID=A0AA36JFG7_9DINO|nr:unnamed protein product [Effrenium voratum]
MGYTEPLIKLDVLIHNCGIFYAQLQMESAVPLSRKILAKIFKLPVSRRGQLLAQGPMGIFKMWRERGDTYNLINYISQVTFLTPLASLNPRMGKCLMYNEKVAGEKDPPDPPGSGCCCPHTPPPPMMGTAKSILDRYCKRIKGELNVYGRKLVTRPSRCKDLCCGKGIRCGCECCCCCQLDELLTEFIVTTHRILVEQRAAQRYCRCTAVCRRRDSTGSTRSKLIEPLATRRLAGEDTWGMQKQFQMSMWVCLHENPKLFGILDPESWDLKTVCFGSPSASCHKN